MPISIFLGMLVEIALAKRERIERIEQLCHLLDAHLDRISHALLAHSIIWWIFPAQDRKFGVLFYLASVLI
jgi:hypothetical protein